MSVVHEILARKGRGVHTIQMSASVLDAIELMNKMRIGGVVVMDGSEVVGIFTERDVLRRAAEAGPKELSGIALRDAMTTPVERCGPDTPLLECVAVMTRKHIRHLPVVDDSGLCGLITSGDIMAFQITESEATIRYLKGQTFDVGGEGG